MGKRVNYELSNGDAPAIVLYVNNSHPDIDTDRLFVDAVIGARTVSGIAVKLLTETYPSTEGNHRAFDPIFTIDLEPGDREYVLTAVFNHVFEGRPTSTPTILRDDLDGDAYEVDPDTLHPVAAAPRR